MGDVRISAQLRTEIALRTGATPGRYDAATDRSSASYAMRMSTGDL